MDVTKKEQPNFSWHSAFFAGLQIELEKEADQLIFENEHQLGTNPMEIDVVVIKKNSEVSINKNVGRIFKKYNIIEYKSPDDYLSIDDFYKVYGYTCFYKSDVPHVDMIKVTDMTISFVCYHFPRRLIQYLYTVERYETKYVERGIYQVVGDTISIQIIVVNQLSEEENLWISSLTNQLNDIDKAKRLVDIYNCNKKNPLYESMMDIIVGANPVVFEEVYGMCQALEEIKDRVSKRIGEEIGKEIGVTRVNNLNIELSKLGRLDDILKAAQDKEYQEKLFIEFGL